MTTTIRRVLAVLAVAAAASNASADTEGDRDGCTNASLHGLYMFAANGFSIVNGVAQPKAIMEQIYIAGDGFLSVPGVTVSINGNVSRQAGATGTYAVARDCTGTLAFGPPGPAFDIFVMLGGDEFYMKQNQQGNVLQGRVV
jgi:hypothetical protein